MASVAADRFPDEHWKLLRSHGEPGENTLFFNHAGAFLLKQEHWWCRHTPVAAEMLYLFQFDGIAIVDQLRAQSERQLGRCAHCVLAYHHAVADLRPRYQQEFQQQSVDDFFGILRRRDVERLARCLAAGTVDTTACIYSVYEALRFPEVLQVQLPQLAEAGCSSRNDWTHGARLAGRLCAGRCADGRFQREASCYAGA